MNAIFCQSRLPPSGGTWKYAKVPSTKKTRRDSLPIDMLLSAVSVLVVAQSSSEILEGLMNNPVLTLRVAVILSPLAQNVSARKGCKYASFCYSVQLSYLIFGPTDSDTVLALRSQMHSNKSFHTRCL